MVDDVFRVVIDDMKADVDEMMNSTTAT